MYAAAEPVQYRVSSTGEIESMLSIFDKWTDAGDVSASDRRTTLRLEALETRILLSAAGAGEVFEGPEMYDVPGDDAGEVNVHPHRIILGYDPATIESTQQLVDAVPGATVRSEFASSSAVVVQLPSDTNVADALEVFAENQGVKYAEPDFLYEAQLLPDDTDFSSLWGLHNTGQTGGTPDADIDAPEAWDFTTGSDDVLVGVVDSGVDLLHEDLADNIWVNPGEIAGDGVDNDGNGYVDDLNGWDFYEGTNDPADQQGHGTHVAGTIGAVGDNGTGVTGVNWDVQIGALAIGIEDTGFVSTVAAVEAVEYAADMGFDVLNMSWGGGGAPSTALRDAIAAAGDEGVLVVAAAGNSGLNNDVSPTYPASFDLDNVISVAASDHNDQMASFSNYGSTSVDLAAPGVGIYSTQMDGGYMVMDGTSMAAPHVAGVAALLRAYNPSARVQDLRSALLDGAESVTAFQGLVATGGRLNANDAIAEMWTPVGGVDLQVTEAQIVPEDLHGATEVVINSTVRNFGDTGFSDTISVEYYLSDNNIIGAEDTLLGSYTIDGMDATGIDTQSLNVSGFPPDDPFQTDGFYFLLGEVDASDAVEEVAEDNNTIARNVSWARRDVFVDDFSSDTGWTGFLPDRWERGVAMAGGGEYGNPDPAQDASPTTDDMLLGYNIGGDYENSIGSTRWVTSPVIDCSDYRDVKISFDRWLNVESSTFDHASIQVFDGANWQTLWSNPSNWITDDQWNEVEFDVSHYADNNGNFQVRFGMGPTDSLWRFSGWNVDDFTVSGKPDEDFVPPQVESLNIEEINLQPVHHIRVQFNEDIPGHILSNTANYELIGDTWGPISINSAEADTDSVLLEINGQGALPQDNYTLTVLSGGIEDDWGNDLDGNGDGDGGDDFVFSFETKLAGAYAGSLEMYGGQVTFYDTNYGPGDLEIDARPEAWIAGSPGTGITAVGLRPQYTDFGVVIEQAPNSSQPIAIYDQTFSQRPISFIIADADVSQLHINSRLSGRDLNGLYVGRGFQLPGDIDGDGDSGDATGFFSSGQVGSARVNRGLQSDFVSEEDANALIFANGGGLIEGETHVGGDLGFMYGGPSLNASLSVEGRIQTLVLGSGSGPEGMVGSGTGLGRLESYGDLEGGVNVAGSAGSIIIHGNLGRAADDGAGNVAISGHLNSMLVLNGNITSPAGGHLARWGSEERISVGDGLGSLRIYGGDFWGSLHAEGDVGNIVVGGGSIGAPGSHEATIQVHSGGLGSLTLYNGWVNSPAFGAQISVAGDFGSARIYGDLHGGIEVGEAWVTTMQPATQNADMGFLLVAGNLDAPVVVNGRIDQIIALNGVSDDALIQATGGGGRLFSRGNMSAHVESWSSWDTIHVSGGDLVGSVNVHDGDLGSLLVIGGSLEAGMGAEPGVDVSDHLGQVIVTGGGLPGTVMADSVGNVGVYGGGSLSGDVMSAVSVDRLYVAGDVSGLVDVGSRLGNTVIGDSLTGSLRGGSLGSVYVGSDVDGALLRADNGGLDRLRVNSDVRDSEVSAVGRMNAVSIGGDLQNSDVRASRLETVWVGDRISGLGHEIRAESGWFRLYNRGSSWLITEDDQRTIGGVNVYVSA